MNLKNENLLLQDLELVPSLSLLNYEVKEAGQSNHETNVSLSNKCNPSQAKNII